MDTQKSYEKLRETSELDIKDIGILSYKIHDYPNHFPNIKKPTNKTIVARIRLDKKLKEYLKK
jgi:hypothetical protein